MAYFVGLTGGIGSGKSTVSQMLAKRGAVIVDADEVVREIQQPGTDAFREIVETFGDGVVAPDGTLDRKKVATIAFADPDALEKLNAIMHPKVGARFAQRVGELTDTDEIVVLDIPLLGASKSGSERFADAVVVVTTGEDARIARLEERGMGAEDARARMRAQISDAEREKMADHVIRNDGTIADLEAEIDQLWEQLRIAAKERTK